MERFSHQLAEGDTELSSLSFRPHFQLGGEHDRGALHMEA
jgi:hypothetical protein